MKTQNANNKLKFDKNSLSELNQTVMKKLIGGTAVHGGDTNDGSCIPQPIKISINK